MSEHGELCESAETCINRKPGCACVDAERAAEIARLRERVRVLELFQTEAIAARSILGLKGSLGFAHKFEADSIWAGYRNARNAATDAAKAMEGTG